MKYLYGRKGSILLETKQTTSTAEYKPLSLTHSGRGLLGLAWREERPQEVLFTLFALPHSTCLSYTIPCLFSFFKIILLY